MTPFITNVIEVPAPVVWGIPTIREWRIDMEKGPIALSLEDEPNELPSLSFAVTCIETTVSSFLKVRQ